MSLLGDQHDAPPSGLSGAQKAAILLLCLPEAEATALMQKMAEADITLVSREMSRLGDMPARVRMDVLAEFCDLAEAYENGPVPTSSAAERFGFLLDLEPQELEALLRHEPARTTAIVLAHLPPAQAGPILAALAPQNQVQVIRQIAAVVAISPHELALTEKQLEIRVAGRARAAAFAPCNRDAL